MRNSKFVSPEQYEKYERLLTELKADDDTRPRRKLFGAGISEDGGETWKLKSLCSECVKLSNFEPPTRVRVEGVSGILTCDFCGAKNEMYDTSTGQ